MLILVIRLLYVVVCAGAIASYVYGEQSGHRLPIVNQYPFASFIVMLVTTQVFVLFDLVIPKKRIDVVSAIYFGLLIGFLLSYLLIQALSPVIEQQPFYNGIVVLTTLVLPYLCVSLILQTKDDFRFIIPYVEFMRDLKGGSPWILDTSALIDGRIADLVETNVVDAQIVVPQFVLHEVQEIADSSDKTRRTRGRRGLEVLNKLQNDPNVDIRMHETRNDEYKGLSVDQRLVELCKELRGRVVTNDFNLNKVASVQGVNVINLNDVANSLKPRYLPGERIRLKILKEGEAQGQGVGYLDDGTMVVCEQSSHLIGQQLDVIVTSVLQSSAGRMIFGRQVHSTNREGN